MENIGEVLEKLEFGKMRARIARYTISTLGKELVEEIRPFVDLDEVEIELEKVSEFKRLIEEDDPFPLDGINDIRDALHKAAIEGNFITPSELSNVASFLKASRNVKAYFVRRTEKYPLLSELAGPLYTDKVLEYNIERAIDENGNVKDGASRELREIRKELISKADSLRKRLEGILKTIADKEYAQEDIITQRDGRMVIPVKAEHKRHIPGFIHSTSATGATVFIEPAETLEMNNEISTLHFQEQREIERILRELTSQIREQLGSLRTNVSIFAQIDFLHAKGKYSVEVIGAKPKMKKNGTLRIIDARHPILLQRHRRDEVVPLTLELGEDFCTLVITGPNAGGKSVALKTVGVLSLMAQSGMHVPASEQSEFRLFGKMFVDIGDDQSIENDVSTFSSHLVNLKRIVEQADDASLVLVDEIGAGTDPTEGGALAASVLEYLTKLRALTIATTHHGVLKAFAHETEGVENGAMEFDQETLRPTYRFRAGLPGSSYAFEMAERLGLPMRIMQRSREIVGLEENKLEDLLSELEARSQEYQKKLRALDTETANLDALMRSYEEKTNSLKKETKLIKQRAVDEANDIVVKANATLEKAVKEIREQQAAVDVVKSARLCISELKHEIAELDRSIKDEELEREEVEFKLGDYVLMKGGTERGQIIAEADASGKITVAVRNVKVKAKPADLVRIESDMVTGSSSYVSNMSMLEERDIQREIDLRGMMGDEAISVVEKFLDDAYVAGLERVDIIHGKGTGVLRNRVSEYLRIHPRVKFFRLGEWNEGGSGVTVVELEK